jgi:hypothetical protein
MTIIPNPLEEPEADGGQEQTAQEMAKDAEEPASVLLVRTWLDHHVRTCKVLRMLRRWAMVACVLLGMVLTFQGLLVLFGRAALKDVVRTTVREEMSRPTMAADHSAPPWEVVPSAHAAADIGKAAP